MRFAPTLSRFAMGALLTLLAGPTLGAGAPQDRPPPEGMRPPPLPGGPPPWDAPPPGHRPGPPPPGMPPPPPPPRFEPATADAPSRTPTPDPAATAMSTETAQESVPTDPGTLPAQTPIFRAADPEPPSTARTTAAEPTTGAASSPRVVAEQSARSTPTLAPTQAQTQTPARTPRSLTWLLLPGLALALWAWWMTMRHNRRLASQAAHLTRQQRALQSAHRNLQEKSRHLRQLSTQDPLTGVLNRLAFGTELRERLEHLSRYSQPLNLIVFDLDHFKAINDRFGHSAGDRALTLVVGIVREHLVSDDLFGRFGGDEFMIACAGQTLATGAALAEAIRAAVVERAPYNDPPLPGLSLSMGLAQADNESGYSAEALFERADAALYEAKQRGRNTVVVAEGRMEAAPGAALRHL